MIVESGDPGGDSGEFEAFLSESLGEWCGFDPDITVQQAETIVGFNPALVQTLPFYLKLILPMLFVFPWNYLVCYLQNL